MTEDPKYQIRRVYPPDILSPSFDLDAYRAELLEDHAEHMREISEGHKATWHIQPPALDPYSAEYDVDADVAYRLNAARNDAKLAELKASIQAIIDQAQEMKDADGEAVILLDGVTVTLKTYSPLPNASPLHHFSEIMNSGGTIRNPENWEQGETENEWTFTAESRNEIITIHFANMALFFSGEKESNKLTISMRGVKKIWRYLLQKLMQQSRNGQIPDEITIDLNEMVALGMYSTPDNAWRAITDALRKLSTVDIGRKLKGKKKEYGGVLFYHRDREDGNRVKVSVNKNFGFEYYRRQYTYSPNWMYALNDGAFTLSDYIFYLMRQNSTQITEKKTFKIMLRSLHAYMGLKTPAEIAEKHGSRHTQFIKKPILEAIDEVNKAASNEKGINGKFSIRLHAPKGNSIQRWLDEGYLTVTATGEYTEYLQSIADQQRLYDTEYKATRRIKKGERTKKAARKNATADADLPPASF